jgi:hypothetical protein
MDISYKTKKMVENGLVLDERGTWIPLIDKLRMERFFIERLSAGEVLFNKRWVPISEVKTVTPSRETSETNDEKNSEPQKEPLLPAQESTKPTGSFIFNDFLNEERVEETAFDETNHSETIPAQITEFHSNPKELRAPSADSILLDHNEHETVVLPAGKFEELQNIDDSMITAKKASMTQKIPAVSFHENIDEILESIEEFDEWEKKTKKRQALLFAIVSGVAAIIGSSAILALLLI